MSRAFLTAEWNNLIMANYIVDPAVLLPYLPAKTELDFYNGNAYVSLIGFMFENTRLLGIKVPGHVNFEEVNLRFYVRYNHRGNWRRGVVFIKEIVPRSAISFIANTFYNEKYSSLPMSHFRHVLDDVIQLGYHWKCEGKWNRIEATTTHTFVPMKPGSLEEFIAEHYWGYSRYSANITVEYAVQHPPWGVFPVKEFLVDCDFTALYGARFSSLQTVLPGSVFVAKGSRVSILQKRSL